MQTKTGRKKILFGFNFLMLLEQLSHKEHEWLGLFDDMSEDVFNPTTLHRF